VKKIYLVTAIIISQILFLSGMVAYHNVKLSGAKRVILKTVPYDPMSMFRGRYVNLRYEISSLPRKLLKDATVEDIKGGEDLFVKLKKEGDIWVADSVYKKRPDDKSGVYIRGRLRDYWFSRSGDKLSLEYGIEAYFLNEDSAKEVDKANLGGGNWQENQKRREENLAKLDPETRRIGKEAGEWWVKKLNTELQVWVKEGTITKETSDALTKKYDEAIEKYEAANETTPARSDSKPVLVEIAIDKEGNGYPTKIIIEGKEYR